MTWVRKHPLPNTGDRFGKWEVIAIAGKRKGRYLIRCRCDCGSKKKVDFPNLYNGVSKGCGCTRKATLTKRNFKHGGSGSRLYNIWCAMKGRCANPLNAGWRNYGGRGIQVCLEWRNDFEAFRKWALANGYYDTLEIDRYPNNDGNYEPGNCRWVTRKVNSGNTRRSILITAFGETKTAKAWSQDERCLVDVRTLTQRIRSGISGEDVMQQTAATARQ